jgi:hypothetical protein
LLNQKESKYEVRDLKETIGDFVRFLNIKRERGLKTEVLARK